MENGSTGVTITQEARQEMTLTPRQMQSLEILASPAMELRQKIARELAENPLVEELPPEEEVFPDTPAPQEQPGCEKDDLEESLAKIVELSASGAADEESTFPYDGDSEADEKREFFFNSIADKVSMQEELLKQLSYSDVSPSIAEAARTVIGSIDENGYCRTHLADIATGCSCSMEDAQKALDLVQRFDPPGIGARDLKECLLLQMSRKKISDPLLETIITKHLDDLAANRLPKAAKELGIPLEELNEKIRLLKQFDPRPGSSMGTPANAAYVEIDVFVVPDGDEFKVIANKEIVPKIRISRNYLKILEDPASDPETRAWLKNRLLNGKGLIHALEQRESTILRIAKVIVSCQYDFLRNGPEHLKPMTMRQAADRLDLHETTVSRAIAGKYMKTPVGVFEFRYFFTAGFRSGEGEDVSSRGVQEMIRRLIGEENPSSPLSDSTLTEKLREKGLDVARRTVAKYREAMGIPASHLRRKYE